jgi:hypothetical protein
VRIDSVLRGTTPREVWYLASRDNLSIYTDCAYLDIDLLYHPTAAGITTLMDHLPVVERDRATLTDLSYLITDQWT